MRTGSIQGNGSGAIGHWHPLGTQPLISESLMGSLKSILHPVRNPHQDLLPQSRWHFWRQVCAFHHHSKWNRRWLWWISNWWDSVCWQMLHLWRIRHFRKFRNRSVLHTILRTTLKSLYSCLIPFCRAERKRWICFLMEMCSSPILMTFKWIPLLNGWRLCRKRHELKWAEIWNIIIQVGNLPCDKTIRSKLDGKAVSVSPHAFQQLNIQHRKILIYHSPIITLEVETGYAQWWMKCPGNPNEQHPLQNHPNPPQTHHSSKLAAAALQDSRELYYYYY